jgi:hypothetical protein
MGQLISQILQTDKLCVSCQAVTPHADCRGTRSRPHDVVTVCRNCHCRCKLCDRAWCSTCATDPSILETEDCIACKTRKVKALCGHDTVTDDSCTRRGVTCGLCGDAVQCATCSEDSDVSPREFPNCVTCTAKGHMTVLCESCYEHAQTHPDQSTCYACSERYCPHHVPMLTHFAPTCGHRIFHSQCVTRCTCESKTCPSLDHNQSFRTLCTTCYQQKHAACQVCKSLVCKDRATTCEHGTTCDSCRNQRLCFNHASEKIVQVSCWTCHAKVEHTLCSVCGNSGNGDEKSIEPKVLIETNELKTSEGNNALLSRCKVQKQSCGHWAHPKCSTLCRCVKNSSKQTCDTCVRHVPCYVKELQSLKESNQQSAIPIPDAIPLDTLSPCRDDDHLFGSCRRTCDECKKQYCHAHIRSMLGRELPRGTWRDALESEWNIRERQRRQHYEEAWERDYNIADFTCEYLTFCTLCLRRHNVEQCNKEIVTGDEKIASTCKEWQLTNVPKSQHSENACYDKSCNRHHELISICESCDGDRHSSLECSDDACAVWYSCAEHKENAKSYTPPVGVRCQKCHNWLCETHTNAGQFENKVTKEQLHMCATCVDSFT